MIDTNTRRHVENAGNVAKFGPLQADEIDLLDDDERLMLDRFFRRVPPAPEPDVIVSEKSDSWYRELETA